MSTEEKSIKQEDIPKGGKSWQDWINEILRNPLVPDELFPPDNKLNPKIDPPTMVVFTTRNSRDEPIIHLKFFGEAPGGGTRIWEVQLDSSKRFNAAQFINDLTDILESFDTPSPGDGIRYSLHEFPANEEQLPISGAEEVSTPQASPEGQVFESPLARYQRVIGVPNRYSELMKDGNPFEYRHRPMEHLHDKSSEDRRHVHDSRDPFFLPQKPGNMSWQSYFTTLPYKMTTEDLKRLSDKLGPEKTWGIQIEGLRVVTEEESRNQQYKDLPEDAFRAADE